MDKIDKLLKGLNFDDIFSKIERNKYEIKDLNYAVQIFERIGKMRVKNYVVDNENRFVIENLIKWICGDETMQCQDIDNKTVIQGNLEKGIYLSGNTGVGKSLILEILSAFAKIDDIKVIIDKENYTMSYKTFRADQICYYYSKEGDINEFKQKAILCIQDVGAEQLETIYMGNRLNVIRNILEYRGDFSDKITLITSNYPFNHKAFLEKYGERVSSRLYEHCNYFELKGNDRRKIKK